MATGFVLAVLIILTVLLVWFGLSMLLGKFLGKSLINSVKSFIKKGDENNE